MPKQCLVDANDPGDRGEVLLLVVGELALAVERRVDRRRCRPPPPAASSRRAAPWPRIARRSHGRRRPCFRSTTCWPHVSESRWPSARATTSVTPPAAAVTVRRDRPRGIGLRRGAGGTGKAGEQDQGKPVHGHASLRYTAASLASARGRERITSASAVGFEVPIIVAARSFRNFKSKDRTNIIKLLVVLRFRSSQTRVPHNDTSFGIGTLATLDRRLRLQRIERLQRLARRHLVGIESGQRLATASPASSRGGGAAAAARPRTAAGRRQRARRGAVLRLQLGQHHLGALDHGAGRPASFATWMP